MAIVKLDRYGRMSLPLDVRRHLKVSAGDGIQFVIDTRGEVRVRAGTSGLAALRGILRKRVTRKEARS